MVRLQFQYMSIRRLRRKQAISLVNEQEERAKQKLFQISYLDDQSHFDDSSILLPNTCWQRQPARQAKQVKIKTTREVGKKKSQSLGLRNDDVSSIENLTARRGIKTLQLDALEEPSAIFNTLESNSVFVGNKNVSINTARAKASQKVPLQSNKKRIETMPAIKQKSYLQLPKEELPSTNKLGILTELPKQKKYRPQKLNLVGLLTHKNAERQSYIKLKHKLKRDLFICLEQRLALNNQLLF